MNRKPDRVAVHVDVEWLATPRRMGWLHRQSLGRGEIFAFEYDPAWLDSSDVLAFDPELALVSGPQYPPVDRDNFGIFLDSAPDRWGRLLMQRREVARARLEKRATRNLHEWDFLLGVHDETRLGALRFCRAKGVWHDDDQAMAAPPLTSLRSLQAASARFEAQGHEDTSAEDLRWLEQLIASGSSLGGARPKASVRDEDGDLCIAKFPSRRDYHDVGAWEYVAHRLAQRAGIRLPTARVLSLGEDGTSFLTKRFDRTKDGRRRAFVSAMTLTQRRDGEPDASYLELVDLLQSRGTETLADCTELFRRVVFSIAIHNTGDHLRNHGFIIAPWGLRLAPAYDINPVPDCDALTLAINEVDTHCDFGIALDACRDYGLAHKAAREVIHEVPSAVSGWREEASALGIPRSEQERMAPAFQA